MPSSFRSCTASRTPRTLLTALLLVLAATPAFAVKSCEELAREIAEKLDAAGVQDYVLEIVPNRLAEGEKVVGSCNGGTRKITYTKGRKKPAGDAPPPQPPTPQKPPPR